MIWTGLNTFYLKQNKIVTLQSLTHETNLTLRKLRPFFSGAQAFSVTDTFDNDMDTRSQSNYSKNCLNLLYNDGTSSALWLQEKPEGTEGYFAFFRMNSEGGCQDIAASDNTTQLSEYIFVVRENATSVDDKTELFVVDDKNPLTVQFNVNAQSINPDLTTIFISLNQSESITSSYLSGLFGGEGPNCMALEKKQHLQTGQGQMFDGIPSSTKFDALYINVTNWSSSMDQLTIESHSQISGASEENGFISMSAANGNKNLGFIKNALSYVTFRSEANPRTLFLNFYALPTGKVPINNADEVTANPDVIAGNFTVTLHMTSDKCLYNYD